MADLKLLVLVVILQGLCLVHGQRYRARCLSPITAGHDFRFEFRFDRQTITAITKIAFYSSTGTPTLASTLIETPANQCRDTTVDANGLLIVGFSVDGGLASLPCGIIKSGNTYTITVAAIGGPTTTAYRFQCITTGGGANLNFPANLSITNFKTGNIDNKLAYRGNQINLRFEVVHAYGNKAPSLEARGGEYLQLRGIYEKDYNNGADHWGQVFHITFVPHNDAEMSLLVVTPGLGTWVKVTGPKSGATFTKYYPVKTDVETKIIIPDDYKTFRNGNERRWHTQRIAIKVEVVTRGDVVAIRALSKKRADTEAGAFMAMPDDVLGTTYPCYTGAEGRQNGLVLVYAVQDATTLSIDFNAFGIGDLRINNVTVTATITTLRMNENDVLTMQCDRNCHLIQLSANRPIGVVTGFERQRLNIGTGTRNHMVSQLPPVSTFGKQFVLVPAYFYLILLADPTARVDYTRQSGTVTNVAANTFITNVAGPELFIFTTPVLLMALPTSAGSPPPYTMPYPSTYQWTIRHYVFVQTGVSYTFTIVAQTGETTKIEFRDKSGATNLGTRTLDTIPGFSATAVLANSGSAYESYTFSPTNPITKGPALIELRSGSNEKPFMLVVKTTIPGHDDVSFMAIGTRFPTVNPCVPSSNAANSFGTSRDNIPGDMIDNDCDGAIDNDLNDGQNSENDLAPHPVNENVGIYVNTLWMSNNAQFRTDGTSITYTLLTNGCPVNQAIPLSIMPFKWNKGIGEQYTGYHVIETASFRAFYLGTPVLYFRADFGLCEGNLTGTRCDNSCQTTTTGRKRREEEETIRLETQLSITDAETAKYTGSEETCPMNTLYYIPAVLLLLIIFVEAFMNGVLIYIRVSLKHLD